MKHAIIFFTFDRTPHPQYINQTLEMLSKSDPRIGEYDVHIVIDGDNSDFVTVPAGLRCSLHPLPKQCEVKNWEVHRRIGYSYHRAFEIALRYETASLICEDDIAFRNNWTPKLAQVLEEIRSYGQQNGLLSLYQPSAHEVRLDPRPTERCFYRSFMHNRFMGGQSVLFPRTVIEKAIAFWKQKQWENRETAEGPNDLCIGKFALSLGPDQLYVCTPVIVQHIGSNTGTGLSRGWYHSSVTFNYEWPES